MSALPEDRRDSYPRPGGPTRSDQEIRAAVRSEKNHRGGRPRRRDRDRRGSRQQPIRPSRKCPMCDRPGCNREHGNR